MDVTKYLQEHWLTVSLLAIVGVWIAVSVIRNAGRIRTFCVEVWVELAKCSWPWDPQQTGFKRYRELRDSTVVVVVSTLLLAGFVTSSDFMLNMVVGWLTTGHARGLLGMH